MSSFVVASADLSLRRAEVEEKRDKIHKESKALLDYTWKAITKLTELKKMLEKFKNDVEKQQVEQMADWQTKLVMMDSKERQYILQVSNYKNQDQLRLAARQRHEEAGGPKIPMKYGRVDVTAPEQCPPEGRLPGLLAMGLFRGSFSFMLGMGCGVYVAQNYNIPNVKKLFNTYVFLAKHIEETYRKPKKDDD